MGTGGSRENHCPATSNLVTMPVRIADRIQSSTTPLLSIEFFPPKTERGQKILYEILEELEGSIDYISITQHSGAKVGNATQLLVADIKNRYKIPTVAHTTSAGCSRQDMNELLGKYVENDIHNVLALRGDAGQSEASGDFAYAGDLVQYIRETFPAMSIGVAAFPEGHPECPNRLREMDYMKAKIDAGSDYMVSQLFFDNRDFLDFAERCQLAGIGVPLVAGILPITSMEQMQRMADLAAGARVPAPLLRKIYDSRTAEEIRAIGIDWAIEQSRALHQAGFPIHIYGLNDKKLCLAMIHAVRQG